MKLNTVNVVEYADDAVLGVKSFSGDEAGIKEAEECFKVCIKENGENITDEEMDVCLEDGYFEQGEYQVFLTHSS